MRPARDSWVNPVLALLLCGVVGAGCAALHLPLPWMIGPLLAMAACNFADAELCYLDRLALLLAIAAAAGLALDRFRLPNAYMFGPLAAVIALTANGTQFSSLPPALSNAAQRLLGCALEARFERRSLQSAPRYVAGVIASVLVAIAATAAVADITAKVLQLGVPLVTAAHVTRVVVLITATGPSFRAARALSSRLRKR